MSWSDLFYPENPERREKLIRKSQEVRELMKNNFRATNQLGEALNKYLGLSFSPIALNEKATVKENCDIIIERIREIQAEVEKIDDKLKAQLEPTLYENLKNMSLSVPEFQLVVSVVHAACGVAAVASTAVYVIKLISWLIKNIDILTDMREVFLKIGDAVLGTVVLGVFFAGIDMIVQAIIGSIERHALERALEEMLSALFGEKDELKKEELLRSTQTLHHYVHKYFNITNRLLKILNTHLNQSPSPALVANESESIEENCGRVRNVMRLILDVSEKENKHVRKSTEPALYERIAFSGASLNDKAAVIKDLHQKTMGLLGNVFGPVIAVRLANSDLASVMPPVEHNKFQPVLSFALGDLVQSSARITVLLCRSGEKSLDEAVQLVEAALSVLKPPCDCYNDIVCEVEAYVTIISENM
ncbi:single-pass membrane and coiled-coil domain-containing 3-like protein [Labeo rohita]|uniref:Single-pass membrane and coiled-coil domain-containing 3-like protein n=1 Tax=Labeo rohita TaxID=84645 RepID=A0A498MQW8_LABRO|nr:single-pass membrane and coiled-coil domain-containing 3-like protein [Labeo rohita]